MGTMEILHSQGVRVCRATVTHLAACTRAVTTKASVPARKVSLAETAPSVPRAMSRLQAAASVCDGFSTSVPKSFCSAVKV